MIVPYAIDNSFSASERNLIVNSVNDLSAKVKVLKLIPRTNQANYIRVESGGDGCFSSLGIVGTYTLCFNSKNY